MAIYSYNKIKNVDKGIYLILDLLGTLISTGAYIYLAYIVYNHLIGLTGTIFYISLFIILPIISLLIVNKAISNDGLKHIIFCVVKTFTTIIGNLIFIYIVQAYVPFSHKILYGIYFTFAILDIITYIIKFEKVERFINEIMGNVTMIILTYIAYSIMPLNTFLITCLLLYFPKLITTQKDKD